MIFNKCVCLLFQDTVSSGASGHSYLELPCRIGRGVASSKHSLMLQGSLPKISRSHAVVSPLSGDRLRLEDTSANGTLVNGIRLKSGQSHDLYPSDTFLISPFKFSYIHGATAQMVLRWAESGTIHTCPVFDGYPVMVGRDMARSTLAVDDFDQSVSSLHAGISLQHGRRFLVKNWSNTNRVFINNHKEVNAGDEAVCNAGDVVIVGNCRFQLLTINKRMLECTNASCRLLNANVTESECRWCGYHLSGAKTIDVKHDHSL